MQRKSLLLIVAILLASAVQMLAGPRSFSQARRIAEAQAARLGITIDQKAAAKARQMNQSDGEAVQMADYYVFPNGQDRGFTIVSGDDRMPAIVGYADSGTYDADNVPAPMAAFLDDYRATLEAVKRGDASALRNVAEAEALRSGGTRAAAVSPMLGGIRWNQLAPYNGMCPMYDGKNRSATGCVATAMAEVMAYWKYPKELKADIPAYVTGGSTNGGKTISVPGISKGEKYDWDNMLPAYADGQYTQAEADAVAKLMYHCGAAVRMDYGPESGAYVAPSHLAKYFGYDADLMMNVSRSSVTLAQWTDALDRELAAGRPVLYSGSSSSGGHQFVCDGSDGQGLYHISWGWGGYQDGYFDLTILDPDKGGVGSGDAADGYTRGCYMIMGIQPDNGKTDAPLMDIPAVMAYDNGSSTTGLVITNGTRPNNTGKFDITIKQWWGNMTANVLTARAAFGLSDGNGGYTVISNQILLKDMTAMSDYGSTSIYPSTSNISYAFKKGTYSIYALYSTDGGATWRKCAYPNSHPYVIDVTSTRLAQTTPLAATITTAEKQYNGQEGTFRLKVTNNGADEYLGLVKLYTAKTTTMPSSEAASVYMTVQAGATVGSDVMITPAGEGKFYVWATDDDGNVLADAVEFTAEPSEDAVLSLYGVANNAAKGEYETDNAYYGTNRVEAPRVNDDYAEFTYYIKNDGGTTTRNCQLVGYNMETRSGIGPWKSIRFEGGGAITTITYRISPDKLGGGRSIMSDLYVYEAGSTADRITLPATLPKTILNLADGGGHYTLAPINMFVYVAGKTDGIRGVGISDAPSVAGGAGEIVVRADSAHIIKVYAMDGRMVKSVRAEAGATVRIPVRPGLYVVDGQKVAVR